MNLINKRKMGSEGEKIASDFLVKNGLVIAEKNYRNRYGEIDIIAREGDVIVFVEVKLRRDESKGSPLEAVDKGKQKIIRNVAGHYLYNKHLQEVWCRFDVIGIKKTKEDADPEIIWIKDAF